MRKFLNYFLLLAAIPALVFLASCGDDDDEVIANAPTIVFDDDDATIDAAPGDVVTISGTVDAPGGFNVLRITPVIDGTPEMTEEIARSPGSTPPLTFPFDFDFEVTSDMVNADVVIEFDAVDENGLTGIADFMITVEANEINTFTVVLLGAQGSTEPSFYDAQTNTRSLYADAAESSATIDFAYYYGATNGNTLAAIDDGGLDAVFDAVGLPIDGVFQVQNSTGFFSVNTSPTDFEAVENEIDLLEITSTVFTGEVQGNSDATQLVEDQVIAFQLDEGTRAGLFGLIRVASIDDNTGNGTITIDVKVQQAPM